MNSKIVVLALGLCSVFATEIFSQSTNRPSGQATDPFDFRKANITPIGNWAVDPSETAELSQIYSQAIAASHSVPLGPDADSQRHEIDNALREELEGFLVEHPKSAYAPALHTGKGH